MDWGAVRNGKLLAAVYLIALVMLYAGVLWLLIQQWTGTESMGLAAPILFFGGGLAIIALAVALRRRIPVRTTGLTKSMTGHQRAYYRLSLGLEVPGAWRAIKG
jgi:hypothetical protein